MEPTLACTAALLSPSTGIVDSHAYMLALQGEAEAAGALFVFHSPVSGGRAAADGIDARGRRRGADDVARKLLVNSAGLHAPGARPRDRGHAGRAGAHGLLRQGQLLHALRPLAVLAPRSIRCRCPAGSAST